MSILKKKFHLCAHTTKIQIILDAWWQNYAKLTTNKWDFVNGVEKTLLPAFSALGNCLVQFI